MVTKQRTHSIDRYMQLSYRAEIYKDGDYWAAEFPELPVLVAGHETWAGLHVAIEDAKKTYFESMIAHGHPIPEPGRTEDSYSGKILLRAGKSLHRQLMEAARREGISANQLVLTAIARDLGCKEAQSRRTDSVIKK